MMLGIGQQDDRELTMELIKPPMPVHVRDIQNFARLALGLTEGSQMILELQTQIQQHTSILHRVHVLGWGHSNLGLHRD